MPRAPDLRTTLAPMARVLAVGIELGVVIGGSTYLGYLADERWGCSPWLTLGGSLLGLTAGVMNVVREVRRLERRTRQEKRRNEPRQDERDS
ncbi:MAG: AtpZ/AtpI family protein [Phycisphaeraceae bacterium]|nr:AtpZ/AtpI family protein [Phycisphaeraceae bacterium]